MYKREISELWVREEGRKKKGQREIKKAEGEAFGRARGSVCEAGAGSPGADLSVQKSLKGPDAKSAIQTLERHGQAAPTSLATLETRLHLARA